MARTSCLELVVLLVLSVFVGLFVPLFGWLFLLGTVVLALRPHRRPASSHGSARLADWRDAAKGGLLADQGLILGRADLLSERPRKREAATLLKLNRFTHLATFASTGRGKGVSVLIPNLLGYHGSVVVTDPKAENYRITAAYRLRAFGQRQYRLDPFRLCGIGEDSLNPLDFIAETDIDFLDACRDLANQIVLRLGTEHEPHWNDSAEIIIYAIVAYVCACEKQERNLITVRYILTSKERLGRAVEVMQKEPRLHGVIAELGHMLKNYTGDELASILSTVQRHTAFLSSPVVAHGLARSSFDPRELRTPRGASVFLCLPAERLETLAPLMRLWVGTLLRATTRGTPTEEHPVLFLLDEAAHLGRIKLLEQAVTLMRGYGIRLWFFFQSLHQVRECYGEHAATLLDNIDTQQYFGINSFETAEALSKRIGDSTITVESEGETTSLSRPAGPTLGSPPQVTRTTGTSVTRSEIARRCLFPDEILRLPEDVALLFHRNLPAVPATLLKYYEETAFRQALESGTAISLPARRRRARGRWPRLPLGVRVVLLIGLLCFAAMLVCGINGWETSDDVRNALFPPRTPLEAAERRLAEREAQVRAEKERKTRLKVEQAQEARRRAALRLREATLKRAEARLRAMRKAGEPELSPRPRR